MPRRRVDEPGAPGKALEILLLEDDAEDVLLIKEAFAGSGSRSRISVVPDGEEALAFVRCQGRYAGASRPDIVIIDLNVPRKDGREFLAEIKSDPELLTIPVIVLTTSNSPDDIQKAYRLHANCFLSKPHSLDKLAAMAQGIEAFWGGLAYLPK